MKYSFYTGNYWNGNNGECKNCSINLANNCAAFGNYQYLYMQYQVKSVDIRGF